MGGNPTLHDFGPARTAERGRHLETNGRLLAAINCGQGMIQVLQYKTPVSRRILLRFRLSAAAKHTQHHRHVLLT